MTDSTNRSAPIVRRAVIRAVRELSILMALGRVQVTETRTWSGPVQTPGLTPAGTIVAVLVNVTDRPSSRDIFLSALERGDPLFSIDGMPTVYGGPIEWTGSTGLTYREWHGQMLTMSLIVSERVFDTPAPAASDPATDAAQSMPDFTGPYYVPGNSGPGFTPAPAPPVDHTQPVDEPAAAGRVRMALVNQSAEALRAKYAATPGVTVVDEAEASEAWSQYARIRALKEFRGTEFATLADALTALNVWPGRDMLEEADALAVAQQLVQPSAVPPDVPAEQAAARGRLLPLLPWFGGEQQPATTTGPIRTEEAG